jgi:hypothetical protein
MALRIKDGPRGRLLAAHFSFFLLNMATMPHWMIEGDLLYGIICGYTLFLALGPAKAPAPRTRAAPQAAPPRVLNAEAEPVPIPVRSTSHMSGMVSGRRR